MENRTVKAADLDAARKTVLDTLTANDADDAARTAATVARCESAAQDAVAAAADAAAWARTCDNIAARKYATDNDRAAAAVARADARKTAAHAAAALDALDAARADAVLYDTDTARAAVYATPATYICRARCYSALDARADALTAAAADARRTADRQPDNDAARRAADAAEKDARQARKDADNDNAAVYYAFPVGGTVDARRPYTAGAYRIAYAIIDALTARNATLYRAAAVRVYHNLDADAVQPAARYVAARTARNAVKREGTPTQWAIDRAARAADWTQSDLADMTAAAADILALAAAPAPYVAAVARDARILARAADLLDKTPAHGYSAARLKIVDAAAARLAVYTATADAAQNRRRARFLADAARAAADLAAAADVAARAAAVAMLTHAAYTAVNEYLTDARAIRTGEKPAHVSLADFDADAAAPLAADYDAARAAAVRQAVRRARAALFPLQATAFDAAACGYSARQAAAKMGVAIVTYHEYLTAARRKLAAALADADAPADLRAAAVALADGLTADALTAAAAARDAAAARADAAQDAAALAAAALADADAAAVRTVVRAALADLDADARAIYAAVVGGHAVRAAARARGIAEATARRKATAAARRILAAAVGVTLPATALDVADAVSLADAVRLAAPYIG